MQAIGFKTSLPISQADSFIQFEKETPVPKGYELLVKIQAVSINPVDYKIRQNSLKDKISDNPKIIGWDAVGVVEAVGGIYGGREMRKPTQPIFEWLCKEGF